MNLFGHDPAFWAAVIGATLIKVFTSTYGGIVRLSTMVAAAVFSAFWFTDPVLHVLRLDPTTYRYGVAALLALTGEGLMRMAIGLSNDSTKLIEFWRAWRGK